MLEVTIHTFGLHLKAQSKGTCFSQGGLLVCRKCGNFLKQLRFLLSVKLELQHLMEMSFCSIIIHVLRVKKKNSVFLLWLHPEHKDLMLLCNRASPFPACRSISWSLPLPTD